MKILWNFISNIGVTPNLSKTITSKIRLTNLLTACFGMIVLFYSSVFFKLGLTFLGTLALPFAVCYFSVLAINKIKLYTLSRVFHMIIFSIVVYVFSSTMGQESDVHFWYFPAMLTSFLIFTLKEKRYLISSSLIVLAGLWILEFTDFNYRIFGEVFIDSVSMAIISKVMVVGSYLTAFFLIFKIVRQLEQTLSEQEEHLQTSHLVQFIDRAIVTSVDNSNLIDNILNSIIQTNKWKVAVYWTNNEQSHRLTIGAIKTSSSKRFEHFNEIKRTTFFETSEGLPKCFKENLKPVFNTNIKHEHDFLGAITMLKVGIRKGLSIPLVKNKKLIGVLEMFSDNSPDESGLLVDEFVSVGERIVQAMEYSNSQQQVKKIAELVFKEKLKFESLIHGLNQGAIVAVTNKQGDIISVNDYFCKISGYSSEELIGANHRILNSGFHSPEFFKSMWQTISSGQVWRGDICNRKKDGSLYWVHTSISKIIDSDGEPQYMAIRFDISNEKKLQTKLIHSEKMSSLGEMAGGVAHEINNPIAVIQGKAGQLLKLVKTGNFTPLKGTEQLEKIIVETDRVAKIVKGLRTFSRNGEKDPFVPVELNNLFGDVVSLCGERFKNHSVALEIVPFSPTVIDCRAVQIAQVITNLLNNAFDAISSCPEKWVRINVNTLGEKTRISITDSGKGIPSPIADKLMHPFFTTKEVGKGTGLGLSISKGIIEDHGGKLWLDTTCSNTCFIIELPVKQIQQEKMAA